MKKLYVLIMVVISNFVYGQGCDDNIQTVFNVAEEPGYSPNTHFMWGKATKLIADHYGCKDKMEEFSGGGNMTALIYSLNWSGGSAIPSNATINGVSWNLHNGSYFSGYQLFSQWITVDGCAEYAKQNYPSLIDAAGRFMVDIIVQIENPGLNNQPTYYHHLMVIWTDLGVNKVLPDYSCEGDTVDFNDKYVSQLPLINTNITASAPYVATPTNGVYVGGNLGTNLQQSATYNVYGQYIVPTENMNPASYPHAGFMAGCYYDYNGGNWAQTSLADLKTLIVDKTYPFTEYNTPSGVQVSNYPIPLWSNDPSVNINPYWSMEGYSSYNWSGGIITYNSTNGLYYLDPSVGSGSHDLLLSLNNQGKCFSEVMSSVVVQDYPGVPSKPRLDYMASFDYVSDSAYTVGSCLVPGFIEFPSGNFIADYSMYHRHKYLCPNSVEDSIEMFIQNPNSNLTYEWKLVVNGFEQILGNGPSMKVRRLLNPAANSGNYYKETVYFRSKNIVNNYSSWEYVTLSYPVILYDTINPNALNSLYYFDTLCHDGLGVYQITNQYLTNETYLGEVSSIPNGSFERKYDYTDWNSSAELSSSGSFQYDWNSPSKLDTFRIVERGVLRRVLSGCNVNLDYCDCEVRSIDVLTVKQPDITSFSIQNDTLNVGEYVFGTSSSNYGGVAEWYIDSLSPAHIGNSVVFSAFGYSGGHDIYLVSKDSYGCFEDTLLANYFFVIGDSLINDNVGDTLTGGYYVEPLTCISLENGGNIILTPNGDGINDVLSVCGDRTYTIKIFNRWGNILYKGNNIEEIDLNGFGKSTYYYIINSDSDLQKGFIELIK